MDPLSLLLSHFPDARQSGRGWMAHCTAHQDHKASLCISQGRDGRVVLHCHAGCSVQSVLAPLGLSMSDLFPASAAGAPKPEPEKVYDYRNEAGDLLYQKLRYPGKSFKQRRPGPGAGEWLWELGTTRRVLYRLPELLKAPPDQPVLLVEGEKDADNLWRRGFVATTNVEGANKPDQAAKWRPEYTEWLKTHLPKRRYVALPDNDAPGLAHMEHVVRSLTNAGLSARLVKLPGLPEKGDPWDWFEAGHTEAELRELLLPRLRLYTWDQVEALPPPVWQLEDLWEEQCLVEAFGMTNHAKSLWVLDVAANIAKGTPVWCGKRILKPGAVCWINADGGRGITKRFKAWRQANGADFKHPFLTYMGAVRLNNPLEVLELLEVLKDLPEPPVLIVFDTLSRCIPGTDENLQGPMTLVTDQCHRLKLETGATVLLIHHTDKEGRAARGSGVVLNEADYAVRVTKDRGVITVTSEKARDGAGFQPLYYTLKPEGESVVLMQSSVTLEAEKVRQQSVVKEATLDAVFRIIADAEQCAREDSEDRRADWQLLRTLLPIPDSTLKDHIRSLLKSGRVFAWNRPVGPLRKRFVYGVFCRSEEDCNR
jgi:hypothetical protein